MSHRNDVMRLILQHERHLQKLKEQQAQMGIHTPPYILTQIEDIEAEINRLQQQLEVLNQPLVPLTIYYKKPDQPEETYEVTSPLVIIGRRPNQVPVDLDLTPDLKVSRLHARLFYDLNTWWVEDLHSKYRTILNRRIITETTPLTPGDELRLGQTILRLAFTPASSSFESTETLPPKGGIDTRAAVDEIEPSATVSEDKRTELLAKIVTIINFTVTQQAMLAQFVRVIKDAFPKAERIAIVLIDQDRELIPWASWPQGPAQVSFTLARQAIKSQEALTWVQSFSRKERSADSLQNTTAALCAPIILNGRVIGVIYLDTHQAETIFDNNERDLLSEIATTLARPLQSFEGQVIPSFPAVFVSYASPDRAFVNRLVADLRRQRIKVWFDERLKIGDNRQKEITRAIKMTDGFVLVMSPTSVTSKQIQMELNIALQAGKRIFPLMYQTCEPPEVINQLIFLQVAPDNYQESLAKLAEAIQEIPKSELVDLAGVAANKLAPPPKPTAEVPVVEPTARPLAARPVETPRLNHILMLAANPRDMDPLRLSEEAETIEERLREAEFRDRFEVVTKWAVEQIDLSDYLLRFKPSIVHFSGHGSTSGKIVLEDKNGYGQTITPRALRQLFRILKDNIRCVVLNACLSLSQAGAIAEEIDCVVGMSAAIGDEAAIRFAGGFYRALGYGRNVQIAFELGCNEIDLANLDQADVPKLLVKPGVNAANITFI